MLSHIVFLQVCLTAQEECLLQKLRHQQLDPTPGLVFPPTFLPWLFKHLLERALMSQGAIGWDNHHYVLCFLTLSLVPFKAIP